MDGIRGHQKVQRSRPDTYTAEVTVNHRIETDRFVLKVSGRIDGIYRSGDGVVIDEIKTTSVDPHTFSQDHHPAHWAQAKVYAYIYASQHGLDTAAVQLTYYQIGTGRIREFQETFSIEDLRFFFQNLVTGYLEWAAELARWYDVRDRSIRALDFPFARFRPGQRKMAVGAYRAIKNGEQLIVQAATGIGKTMAAVFPSVKALGEHLSVKVFYLTARTTGRSAAQQALTELRRHGLRLKSVTLTAKDKICFNPDNNCHPDECEFAKGHFDRVGPAMAAAFVSDALTRENIETLAMAHRVCPFAFSLEFALWADFVICDYNYAFDPRVYLRRFFSETTDDFTFLVDEAHNLVDRSRDMFSAEIRKQPFLDMRRAVKSDLPDLYRCMGKINSYLGKAREACLAAGGRQSEKQPPGDLYPLLRAFLHMADRWLVDNIPAPFRNDLLDLYFSVSSFMRVSEKFDAAYVTLGQQTGREYRLKLFCMDPAGQMREALGRSRSCIFFSATLTPATYFKKILGCEEHALSMAIGSPFPPQHLGLFIAGGISTLFRHRERTAQEIAHALCALAVHKQGNYMFFFPSYAYMDLVHGHFAAMSNGMDITVQTPAMSEPERDAFIAGFKEGRPGTLVGFAVMGGIFGEGIDLVGDRLTGAAVIGVGLPGVSVEREMIRSHFSEVNGAGFEFAYLYPGINRVLQAAGRVIRTGRDRGTVLLIDQRYATRRYGSFFPPEWQPVRVTGVDGLKKQLDDFWGRNT